MHIIYTDLTIIKQQLSPRFHVSVNVNAIRKRKLNTVNAKQINTYSEAVSMCPSTFISLRPAKTPPQNK